MTPSEGLQDRPTWNDRHRVTPSRGDRLRTSTLLALLLLPSLAWVLLNRGIWVSDASLYGLQALRLHHAMGSGLAAWWHAMMSIAPKPPILPWLGQFLVPLGHAIGNVDAALLLIPLLAHGATLFLLYRVARGLFGRAPVAWAVVLVAAAAPLSLDVARQFYVQSLQGAIVMWFVFIALRAGEWNRVRVWASLLAAGSLAALTMLSTPLFCVVPGLVALVRSWSGNRPRPSLRATDVALLLLAVLLASSAALWYGAQFDSALGYAGFGFHDVFAGVPGAAYPGRLAIWLLHLARGISWMPVGVLLVALAAASVFGRGGREAAGPRFLPSLLLAQVALVLCVLALSDQQENRYVLPVVGYVALLFGWVLASSSRAWMASVSVVVLGVQWVAISLATFGINPGDIVPSQRPLLQEDRRREVLARIGSLEDIGSARVLLVTSGLEFYNLQVEYYAAQHPGYFERDHASYRSAEFMLLEPGVDGDPNRAWAEIERWAPDEVVLLGTALLQAQRMQWEGRPIGWGAIMLGAVEISRRVVSSVGFREQPSPGMPELRVFRAVKGP